MKFYEWFLLFLIIAVGVTVGNLIALKVASDQISGSLNSSLSSNPLVSFLLPKKNQ